MEENTNFIDEELNAAFINATSENSLCYYHSEKQVIGGLLDIPKLCEEYLPKISEEDFADTTIQYIFKKIQRCFQSEHKIDIALIAGDCNKFPQAVQLAMQCAEEFVSSNDFPNHLNRIKTAAGQRRIKNVIEDMLKSGNFKLEPLKALINDERLMCSTVEEENTKIIDEFVQSLNKPKEVIYTGFKMLDEKLNGLRKGTLCVIGARASTGKTTFALNIAVNQMKHKKRVYFYSLEMTGEMIYERLCMYSCFINGKRFASCTLTENNLQDINLVMQKIKDDKTFSVIENTKTVETICNNIYSDKPDLAIIDYVQLISSVDRRFVTERERINYVVSELKAVAKQTKTCIILLSQIVRAGKDNPTMSNLKESGVLEEAGDYVILLNRPYVQDKTSGAYEPQDTTLILDKNKFGSTGTIQYAFDFIYQSFSETGYTGNEKIAHLKASRPDNGLTLIHSSNVDETDDLPF